MEMPEEKCHTFARYVQFICIFAPACVSNRHANKLES